MTQREPPRDNPEGLRRRAEALWRKQAADRLSGAQPGTSIPFEEALNLLHELEVHQIELEMQNEELRRAQEEIAASRARYFDLYELAPVGYLTVSEKGLILEANLTVANLLLVDRSQLVNRPLFRFIVYDDQDIYYLLRNRALATRQPQECELRVMRNKVASDAGPAVDPAGEEQAQRAEGAGRSPAQGEQRGEPLWVRLRASVMQNDAGAPVLWVTLSDITEQREAQQVLEQARDDLERRVRERTVELNAANTALGQSRDELRLLYHRLVRSQENERAAIARELHDGASQAVFGVSMRLHVLGQKSTALPEITAQLRELQTLVKTLATELHSLASSLHPDALSRLGLMEAVREHLNRLQTAEGPDLKLETTGLDDRRLPSEVELALYRVIQEAVNNAIKYAEASLIKVVMDCSPGLMLVTVEDDGRGFAPEIPANGRLGLLTMNERIAMLGGSLTINSSPGAGTTVKVELPLQLTP